MADFMPLSREDGTAIRREAGQYLVGVAAEQMTSRLASTRLGNWGAAIVGVEPDLRQVRNWSVTHGRFVNDDDVKKAANVCLIGETVRQKLFPDKANPVGEWLRVPPLRLQVVGVLGEKGRSPTGADQDNQIFIPLTSMRTLVGEQRIDVILASTHNETELDAAKAAIVHALRQQHRLKPDAPNDFDVSSVREMAELAEVLTKTLQILVGIIASISLIVGGIGIMNIMLVSVTERTREIGIRMAVGATGQDVLVQFLIEAVVLALGGGVLGVSLGIGGAWALAEVAGWPLVISPGMVLLAFAVAAGVGIFFGYYPAYKASRLDPIEALRYE